MLNLEGVLSMLSVTDNQKIRTLAGASIGVLGILLLASPVLAQPVQLGPVRVDDRALDQGYAAKRTTTATKTDTSLIDVPQSISVVTKKEMSDRGVSSMQDAVRYVPGVQFAQGEGNRDAAVFRGVSTTSDFFLDGVRDDVEYFRDVYNIDRVEVLRGPNAMIFGRGATGGLINRVTRQANWSDGLEARLEGGSYGLFRSTVDANHPVSDQLALRLTGLYHRADSYRDGVNYERYGVNPIATFLLAPDTQIRLGYENFYDRRIADRGISSFRGLPVSTDRSTFFGDPAQSPTYATVNNVTLNLDHQFAENLMISNKTRYADYDKFYQNVFPGAVNAAGATVSISAYNNAQRRKNLFNQTDLNWTVQTGSIRHTILLGAEFGRQETDNVRLDGSFAGAASVNVPLSNPRTTTPVLFSLTTGGTNHGVADIMAFYAQDQIEITPEWQLVAGIRHDDFKVNFLDRRPGQGRVRSQDSLWSPRLGLIYKPEADMSFYASYSLSYQPRAGAQLNSLATGASAAGNPAFEPEKFVNYEVGTKWDILPNLSLTGALFLLERSNVVVPHPTLAGQGILVDGQSTKGIEVGITGNITDQWSVVGAYSHQIGKSRATATGPYTTLANLPEHTLSVWNRYDFDPAFGAALGLIHQGTRYTTTSNRVSMNGFTRMDGALYYKINEMFTMQLNVENITDNYYYEFAHNDTNITPSVPRFVRFGLTTNF